MTNHYFSESKEAELDPKPIAVTLAGQAVEVFTDGGVFSPEHLDTGTEVLLRQLEKVKPIGKILDIGCGWGPISLAISLSSPKSEVFAIDVNQKCLALTELNTQTLKLKNIRVSRPEEVDSKVQFDEIWSNPPIRIGKKALHEILETWLPRLRSGGVARLVVQKNLGSDSLQKWLTEKFEEFDVSRIDSAKGFRVIKVVRN